MIGQRQDEVAASRPGRGRLPVRLRRFDVFALLLCSLVGLDTIGSIAAAGPEAFSWLLVLGLLFFVPYGLIVAELSAAFPYVGGQYVWTRLAYGRFAAGVVQFVYWLSTPVWIGGVLCVVAMETFETFVHPLPGAAKYLAGLVFIWAVVLTASVPVRFSRWVPVTGALVRIALLTLFLVSTALYGLRGGVQPLAPGDFAPSYLGFLGLVPVILFTFIGFELPSSAAAEVEHPQRTIPRAVLLAGLAAFLMVALPVAGILLVLPTAQVSDLAGFIDAGKAVFTVYGDPASGTQLTGFAAVAGLSCALGLIVALFTSGASWALGEGRAQAVACLDGAGPRYFGALSARSGTPVRVNVLSGVVSTLVLVAALRLTDGDSGRYFTVGLNLAISMTMLAYLLVFPALLVLRRKYPEVVSPFRIPGGRAGSVLASVLATALALFATCQVIWPGLGLGWFGTAGGPDDALPAVFAGQRGLYELATLVPLSLFLAAGVGFALVGRGQRRRAVLEQVPEHTAERQVG